MFKPESEVKEFRYPNGEIQRVQVVRFNDFNQLDFLRPDYNPLSFTKLCNLYRDFIIRRYAGIFGKIIIFMLPDDEIPFEKNRENGNILDPLAVVNAEFQKHIRSKRGKLVFDDEKVKAYFDMLQQKNCLYVAEGRRNKVSFLPFGKQMGFLSECETEAAVKVNGSFFVMDQLDCGSLFDHVGIPIGLMVKAGKILNPPQFERETFMVDETGKVSIGIVSLKDISVTIDNVTYRHGDNAVFYERPASVKTQPGNTDIVVLDNRVVAVNLAGGSEVPSGGFVIQTKGSVDNVTDTTVTYGGLENISFAIQVGNSAIVNGVPTDKFVSKFYNFLRFYKPAYPPSMYPLNYEKARAPRIVLGADKKGHGMLLWLEGAGKFGYVPGEGSCGASLSEAASIAQTVGMVNGVHLDGGGSAQILMNNKKELQCSDRNPDDFSEQERAIPVGLIIR